VGRSEDRYPEVALLIYRRCVDVPALPWKSFTSPESEREYPALLSHLPLATFRATPKFFRFVFTIQHQLANSEGLIGYSLDAHPLAKEYWTLSVWEDRDCLWRFVHRLPHSQAMTDLLPHMGETGFFHFEVKGSSVPPDWKETKRRMRARETEASTQEAGAGFMAVARADELEEGFMRTFKVLDAKIAVANVGGTFYAFDDTCTHLQCSLAEGALEEATVTCRCHGSRFDVTSGARLQGPAQEPVGTYETRVEDGSLKIRANSQSGPLP
jgi:3-phenylpropionate/trans-cinnamate dioxygenase ferredoxin component